MEECKQRKRKEELQTSEERNERVIHKAKVEYLESTYDEIMECQRAGSYYLMCTKKNEAGWKENNEIQNIYIVDSKGNIIVGKRQVLKILGELYYKALRSTY